MGPKARRGSLWKNMAVVGKAARIETTAQAEWFTTLACPQAPPGRTAPLQDRRGDRPRPPGGRAAWCAARACECEDQSRKKSTKRAGLNEV